MNAESAVNQYNKNDPLPQEIIEKAESLMYINKKELKRNNPIRDRSRNETVVYREVRKKKPVKAELPKDLDDNNEYIEKTFVSARGETIAKCVCIVMVFIAVVVYMIVS